MRFGIGFMHANYPDWERFLAAEAGEEVGPPTIEDAQVMRETNELAALSEDFGFDTLWAFEQHSAPYLMICDPTQYLTYWAGRLRNIDVGSMITVLPWHNPMRLAEQISHLQHFLGPDRQYFLGVGRGLARRNFEAVSVSMDEASERFEECYAVLRLAFTQEVFSFEGKHFQYDNVSLRPRPLDATVVTDAWGSWTSEASVRRMGEKGLHPLTTPNKTLESYRQDLALLDEVRAENGHAPAKRPILQVPMFCAETDAEAEEKAPIYVRQHVDSVLKMYELGTDRFGNAKGYEQYTTTGSDFGGGTYEDALDNLTTKFLRDGIIGSPDTCAEKIVAHKEGINPSELMVLATIGTLMGAEAEKSIRLYAEQALPKVAHLRKEEEVAAV
jgi:alkanesulfonate monooxygenase SsuD/methylene tetrahydromethanopterin reductase-like flavin-dependent oxidoreductase (luciferase family)